MTKSIMVTPHDATESRTGTRTGTDGAAGSGIEPGDGRHLVMDGLMVKGPFNELKTLLHDSLSDLGSERTVV